jgi:hypothetical protein
MMMSPEDGEKKIKISHGLTSTKLFVLRFLHSQHHRLTESIPTDSCFIMQREFVEQTRAFIRFFPPLSTDLKGAAREEETSISY